MTPDPALDVAIRQARHLIFAFDGPIRSVDAENPADSTAPITPHIQDAFSACRESGRSVVVITPEPLIDVPAYLSTNDLFAQVTVIVVSIVGAIGFLEATPADCLLVTSSPADIKAAQAAGTSALAYARTPDAAARLIDAGATAVVYSMADVALTLRVHRLDL